MPKILLTLILEKILSHIPGSNELTWLPISQVCESESVGYLVDLLVEYGTKGVRAA